MMRSAGSRTWRVAGTSSGYPSLSWRIGERPEDGEENGAGQSESASGTGAADSL